MTYPVSAPTTGLLPSSYSLEDLSSSLSATALLTPTEDLSSSAALINDKIDEVVGFKNEVLNLNTQLDERNVACENLLKQSERLKLIIQQLRDTNSSLESRVDFLESVIKLHGFKLHMSC